MNGPINKPPLSRRADNVEMVKRDQQQRRHISELRDLQDELARVREQLRHTRNHNIKLLETPKPVVQPPPIDMNARAVVLLSRFVELHEDGGEVIDWDRLVAEAETILSTKRKKKA